MAHGFLTPEDLRGKGSLKLPKVDIPWKKMFDLLNNLRKDQRVQHVRVSEIQNRLEGRDPKALPPGLKMLKGSAGGLAQKNPTDIDVNTGKRLPPGGPRLPGTAEPPSGGRKGGTYTNIPGIAPDGSGGLNASSFLNKETGDVEVEAAFKAGISPEDLKAAVRRGRAIKRAKGIALSGNGEETAAQGTEALVKSRQEVLKTASAVNSPAITPDSGADIVAAVNRNTEAIQGLVSVTKEQTSNDTKLTDRQLLVQEKMLSRQKAAAEEKSLEEGKDMSGFLTPTLKKYEETAKKMGAGPGGQGYSGQLGDGGPNVMDMLDIGSDIMDMRKGKVRRITQGRDGRTARQRLRDMKARKAGLNPSRVAGRGGGLARTGGNALTRGAGMGRGLGTAAKGLGGGGALGGLKGAAKGLGKSGPLALLTAGLEFGDRKAQGQSNLQAGVGTAGSVGGGLAGAAAGAAIGSVIPGVGTVIGGLIGGMLGSMGGGAVADTVTGANNMPSGAGGMLSSGPLSGYLSMLHGTELTLSGNNKKETKNIGEALGEGIIMASLGPLNPKVLELSAKGMKHFYENMGGKDIFKSIFEGVTDALGAVGNMLGSVANSLLGGAAHAGTMPGAGMGMSADEQQLTESLIAAEEGMRQDAYWDDSGKKWTIGYGMTTIDGRAVKKGDRLTKEQAVGSLRSGIAEHQQRAIRQVGEQRWQAMDPKMRAVLTSLTYNYGSIPDRVLGAAKTGTAEDLAKAMDSLYGDNDGILKGRRQREQSILRGNMQGTAGNAVRLDKDFMAGGKFAGTGTGPSVIGSPVMAGTPGTGMATFGETGNVSNAAGYVHGHFQTNTGSKADLVNDVTPIVRGLLNSGVTDVSITSGETFRANMSDAEIRGLIEKGIAKHSHSGDGRSVDIFVPKGTKVPFPLADVKNTGGRGGVTGVLPGSGKVWVGHLTPESKSGGRAHSPQENGVFNMPANPSLASVASPNAAWNAYTGQTPSPVAAAPAAANTGTPMMQTSAQVATAQVASAQPIIVNNNYYSTGGGGQAQTIPNNLTPGIGMSSSGLSAFQELRLRALG